MFIDVRELELHPVEFREQYKPDQIDLGPDMRQQTALKANGRAELLKEHTGGRGAAILDIRLIGNLATRIEVSCARCLEPVTRDVEREFDLIYRPQGADAARGEEISITQAEADIGYYTGDGVQLEDVLREQILLQVPMKIVCSEECKGLCAVCGQNLNSGSCNCKQEQSDPRWDALKGLRDKL